MRKTEQARHILSRSVPDLPVLSVLILFAPFNARYVFIYMQDSPFAVRSAFRRDFLGQLAASSLAGLAMPSAWGQFRVEVSGAGASQIPFSTVVFRGNEAAQQDIAAIVRADLERSGLFRFVDPVAGALDEMSRPDFTAWRQKSTDALVTGSVTRQGDGRFDVRFRAWDTV